ncbi:ABC transporter permease [Corynebacterium hindlerae]|uniref:ABC transporter permease n=1 Tax=Corynebacterium hindlerae TaxID=699041 RepID=UPI0031B71AE3
MYQGFKELRRAPGRSALITTTIGLIAVLVSFLSALTAGLSHQSISALEHLTEGKTMIVADNGASTLSGSRVPATLADEVGGTPLYVGRDRVGDTPVAIMPDPTLSGDAATVNGTLDAPADLTLGGKEVHVAGTQDLWLDHVPVVLVSPENAAQGEPAAILVDHEVTAPEGTKVLTGKDILKTSASYTGENLSLTTMTTLLFAISALVVGAFFTVWTIQRLGGIAITLALGAARKVVISDALTQALLVLVGGVAAGTLFTITVASFAPDSLPVSLTWSTTALPAAILIACGLAGAAFSLFPIFRVDPRSALANA